MYGETGAQPRSWEVRYKVDEDVSPERLLNKWPKEGRCHVSLILEVTTSSASMHFSKTYSELLLSLPPELRDNAIQYRQVTPHSSR